MKRERETNTKIKNSLSVGIVKQTEKHEVEIYIKKKNMYHLLCFSLRFQNKKKVKLIIASHHGIAWNIHKKSYQTHKHKYL